MFILMYQRALAKGYNVVEGLECRPPIVEHYGVISGYRNDVVTQAPKIPDAEDLARELKEFDIDMTSGEDGKKHYALNLMDKSYFFGSELREVILQALMYVKHQVKWEAGDKPLEGEWK